MYDDIAALSAFIFLYSITAGRIRRMPLSGPIIYIAFGLALGPLGLNILRNEIDSETLQILAELTLALVLFTDASNANLKVLRSSYRIPQRLLLIGFPLTILLGFGAGVLIFDRIPLLETAILATILAPTDAALGKPVLTNPKVPSAIREGLNVESGLNDGLCVPVLFVFLTLVSESQGQGQNLLMAVGLVAKQVGIGVIVGLCLTYIAWRIGTRCYNLGWITESWLQVTVFALAITCFATAQHFGGSGFIASFAGGILFGSLAEDKQEVLNSAEGAGDTMALATWVLFGSSVIGQVIQDFDWQILVYSILSLTVIRMLPVYISLAGTGMSKRKKLFTAWFGPRGLASIVFGVIVIDQNTPNDEYLALVIICTVTLSILAHGFTATPMSNALANK